MRRFITAACCIASVLSACGDGDGDGKIKADLDASFSPSTDTDSDAAVSIDSAVVVWDAGETRLACVVVTGISSLPLNVGVGGRLSFEGHLSAIVPGASYAWSGPSGTFTDPTLPATSFICAKQGDYPVSFTVSKAGCPESGASINIACD